MSYSFSLSAPTKAAAKAAVAAKLAEVVASQPSHAHDEAQAQAAADAFIDLVPDSDTHDVAVSVHGSVSWRGTYPTDFEVVGASVGVSASLKTRD